tara:strand:+ start:572 stop:784 length:213 start_codon:yes stop_codon:yes gene_type:complete
MSKIKVKVREEENQTNVYRNKKVIEVDHANKTVCFWETKYTFDELFDFIMETPELANMFSNTLTFESQED